jgi:hypothetical protein
MEYQTLAFHWEPFFPGGVKPQLWGHLLLKAYEKHSLWLGGMPELCMQLVTFIKDKCSLIACLVYYVHICLCLIWVNSYM